MELTVAAIASAFILKAFEKGGEKLAEAVSAKIGSLLNVVRDKFKAADVEGKLTKAQKDPSEENKRRLEQELTDQMQDDPAFAETLKNLVEELKSEPSVQIFFKNVDIKGKAEIGDVEQTNSGGSGRQEALVDVKVGGDFKMGSLKQRQSQGKESQKEEQG